MRKRSEVSGTWERQNPSRPGDSLNVALAPGPMAHLERLDDTGSIKKVDSMSQRRLSPPGSYVFATVSRHMLGVTNDGPALVYEG